MAERVKYSQSVEGDARGASDELAWPQSWDRNQKFSILHMLALSPAIIGQARELQASRQSGTDAERGI